MRSFRATPVVAGAIVLAAGVVSLALVGRPFLASSALILGLVAAIASVLVTAPTVRWAVPCVVPTLVAAVVTTAFVSDHLRLRSEAWGDPGLHDRAALLVGLGLVATALCALGFDLAALVARAVSAVARGLSAAVGGLLFAALIVPAWALNRLVRRDVLRAGAAGWREVGHRQPLPTSLASPGVAPAGRRTFTGRLVWSFGCVALIIVANFAAGSAWEAVSPVDGGEDEEPVPEPSRDDVAIAPDPRVDSPALAAYPWRGEYLADLQRTRFTYWPFTESRPLDFRSEHINIDGWTRRSHQASGDPDAMPLVWMFGGSTTWGEGQRDEYTIASYLVRLSEEAGIPIRMANDGQRGWTHFQELVLFEQRSAIDGPPDVALFYDGANEHKAQSLLQEPVPSHTLAYAYAQQISGGIATELLDEPEVEDPLSTIWEAYRARSFVHRAVAELRSRPVGAQEGYTEDQDLDENGSNSFYRITDEDGRDAGRVYERGKEITRALAESRGVETLFFWQPLLIVDGPYAAARDELSDTTIDIADALADHPETFIEIGHTNEEGARLVAEVIWEHLRPLIEDWYAEG